MRTIPTHDVAKSLENLYASELPRRSLRARAPGRPPKAISLGRDKQNDIDSLTFDSALQSSPNKRTPPQNDQNKQDQRQTRSKTQQKPITRKSTQKASKHTKKRKSRRLHKHKVCYI